MQYSTAGQEATKQRHIERRAPLTFHALLNHDDSYWMQTSELRRRQGRYYLVDKKYAGLLGGLADGETINLCYDSEGIFIGFETQVGFVNPARIE